MPKNAFGVTLPSLYSNTPISRLTTEWVVGIEGVGADRALVAAVDADDGEVLLQRRVEGVAVVDVASALEHPADDLPHHEGVLVEVGGVEVGVLAVLLA